jgi:PilZ domain
MNLWVFHPRQTVRQAAHVAAWIEKEGNDLLERCALIDISENGARLRIADVYNFPTNLTLHLARGSQNFQRCRVIWQRNNDVGVEFVERLHNLNMAMPPPK